MHQLRLTNIQMVEGSSLLCNESKEEENTIPQTLDQDKYATFTEEIVGACEEYRPAQSLASVGTG